LLLAAATVILCAATATRTWWMAVTATLQLVLLGIVFGQNRWLRRNAASVQQHHNQWLRRQLQRQWNEHAAVNRNLEQYDDTALERVRFLQGQLAHLTMVDDDDDDNDDDDDDHNNNNNNNNNRLDRLVELMQQHKQVRAEIREGLRRQVQQHILQVTAEQADRNGSVLLLQQGADLERLLVRRLKAVKGVTLNESALRSLLVTTPAAVVVNHEEGDNEDGNDESSSNHHEHAVLQLLRHAQQDDGSSSSNNNNNNLLSASASAARNTGTGSSSNSIRGGRAIFSFDPTQVLLLLDRTKNNNKNSTCTVETPPSAKETTQASFF